MGQGMLGGQALAASQAGISKQQSDIAQHIAVLEAEHAAALQQQQHNTALAVAVSQQMQQQQVCACCNCSNTVLSNEAWDITGGTKPPLQLSIQNAMIGGL